MDTVTNMVNPFDCDNECVSEKIENLASGVVASAEVTNDLIAAPDKCEEAFT